jgi:hypothetical protein
LRSDELNNSMLTPTPLAFARYCRIIQLLVEQVSVNPDGLNIKIRANGVHSLVTELRETTATHEERRRAV